MTGAYAYLLKVRVESAQALDRLIMEEIRVIKGVTATVRISLNENETNEKGKRGVRRKSRSG